MVLNELSEKISNAVLNAIHSKKHSSELVNELLADITHALEESDVSPQIIASMRTSLEAEIQKYDNPQQVLPQLVGQHLLKVLSSAKKAVHLNPNECNIVTFYGLEGQGKTTTTAKYGHFYKMRGWRVGVVCCDTFRAGSFDQLKQNCTAAKLPYFGSYTEKNPVKIAKDGVAHFQKLRFNMIILDTSGRHKQSEDLLIEMAQIDQAVQPTERIFVVDASIGQACEDEAKAFKNAVDIGSIILTKVDGSAKAGGAIAAVASTNAPISFLGLGEKLDQFEPFDGERFVGRLLGFGDIKGMYESVQNANIDHKSQVRALTKMMEGQFTFKDFKVQIVEMLKMGPMEKLIEMIPGMSAIAKEYGYDEQKEGTSAMIRWQHIMDSMTQQEMELNPTELQKAKDYDHRLCRIARGSGYTVKLIKDFMAYMKQFSEMAKRYGKNQMGQQMKNIMNESVSDDESQMDPKMIANLEKSMQSAGIGGGAPALPRLPGIGYGQDPVKAVAELRKMGLLPGGDKELKKMKKRLNGIK